MTFNQEFFDASLRHQIDLLRFGAGVAKRVNAILVATHADLKEQIRRRLSKGTRLDAGSMRRLGQLEQAIAQRRAGAWNDVTELWTTTVTDVALEEPLFMAGTLQRILPVEVDFVAPAERTLRALATSRPFEGRNLKEWAKSAETTELTRIKQQLRIGMAAGETVQQITSRIFGERGVAFRSLHDAEAVTRTAINHASNVAQAEFLGENSDLFSEEMFVATLDARTTIRCAGLDGKRSPVGKGPKAPQHVRCRSIVVGLIDGEVVGERPFKSGTEQQMIREYAEREGLGEISKIPRGHGAAFEKFRRARMRELTGQVPAKTTYNEWLKTQTHDYQDELLGPARARLFREGGLSLDKFTHRDGDELTLDELRTRYKSAWTKAGLDRPEPPPAPPAPVQRPVTGGIVGEIQYVGRVPPELRAVVDETLARIAPKGTPLLNWMEVHETSAFDVVAFGGVVRAEGYYSTGVGRIKAATLLPAPGRTIADTNFSIGETARTPAEALSMLIAHEYGHHVHIASALKVDHIVAKAYAEAVPKRNALRRSGGGRELEQGIDPEGAPSRYGATNYLEFFAESFAAFHSHRDWLRDNKPVAFRMVEQVLGLLDQ